MTTDRVRPARRITRDRAALAVLAVAVAYVMYGQIDTQVTANTATEEKRDAEDDAATARRDAESVADPLFALCQRDPEVRRRLGTLCDTAAEVKDQPVPAAPPRDGQDGEDGRGIAATTIRDGRLLITYTDGAIEDKGVIVGPAGPAGPAGKHGRSITGTSIVDGSLVLSYSDGSTETAGQVVGRDGDDGRGIAGVAISADFRLMVTYTDGETADVGPLPAGRDGRGVTSVAFDMDSCTATVSYSDGTAEQAPMTGCEPAEPEPDPDPEPEPEPEDPLLVPPLGPLPGGG